MSKKVAVAGSDVNVPAVNVALLSYAPPAVPPGISTEYTRFKVELAGIKNSVYGYVAAAEPPTKSIVPVSPELGTTVALTTVTSLVPSILLNAKVPGRRSAILSIDAGAADVFSIATVYVIVVGAAGAVVGETVFVMLR